MPKYEYIYRLDSLGVLVRRDADDLKKKKKKEGRGWRACMYAYGGGGRHLAFDILAKKGYAILPAAWSMTAFRLGSYLRLFLFFFSLDEIEK